MARPTFWRLLFSTAHIAQGVVVGVFALGVSLFFSTEWNVPGKWFILSMVAAVFCLVVLASMLIQVWPLLKPTLPKVLRTQQRVMAGAQRLILLLEASELFAHGAMVSVYQRQNEIEIFVAIGRVLTIQSDGLIQVVLELYEPALDPQFVANLNEGNQHLLPSLIVKLAVPGEYWPTQ